MRFSADEDLVSICREIIGQGLSLDQWAERESSDMFQAGNYIGGFESVEMEFCFETVIAGVEYWFQFGLDDAGRIASGEVVEIEARRADSF